MAGVTPEVLDQLKALAHRKESREGWFTTRDIQDALGCNEDTARDLLREMLLEGRLDVGKIQVGHEDGYLRPCKIPAYKIRAAA